MAGGRGAGRRAVGQGDRVRDGRGIPCFATLRAPMRKRLLVRMSCSAMTPMSRPTAMDPSASQYGCPVQAVSAVNPPARNRPVTAPPSSHRIAAATANQRSTLYSVMTAATGGGTTAAHTALQGGTGRRAALLTNSGGLPAAPDVLPHAHARLLRGALDGLQRDAQRVGLQQRRPCQHPQVVAHVLQRVRVEQAAHAVQHRGAAAHAEHAGGCGRQAGGRAGGQQGHLWREGGGHHQN